MGVRTSYARAHYQIPKRHAHQVVGAGTAAFRREPALARTTEHFLDGALQGACDEQTVFERALDFAALDQP